MSEEEQERQYQQGEHHPSCPQYQQNQEFAQQGQMAQPQMWQPQTQMMPYQQGQMMQQQNQQQTQPQLQQQAPNPFAPQPSFANNPFASTAQEPISDIPGMLPLERSYIENILRLNRGKIVKVYMTFENNKDWNAKVFRGRIEAAGRDHIILSEPETGKRFLLLMVYLDYVEFDEEVNYEYQQGLAQPGLLTTQQPR